MGLSSPQPVKPGQATPLEQSTGGADVGERVPRQAYAKRRAVQQEPNTSDTEHKQACPEGHGGSERVRLTRPMHHERHLILWSEAPGSRSWKPGPRPAVDGQFYLALILSRPAETHVSRTSHESAMRLDHPAHSPFRPVGFSLESCEAIVLRLSQGHYRARSLDRCGLVTRSQRSCAIRARLIPASARSPSSPRSRQWDSTRLTRSERPRYTDMQTTSTGSPVCRAERRAIGPRPAEPDPGNAGGGNAIMSSPRPSPAPGGGSLRHARCRGRQWTPEPSGPRPRALAPRRLDPRCGWRAAQLPAARPDAGRRHRRPRLGEPLGSGPAAVRRRHHRAAPRTQG